MENKKLKIISCLIFVILFSGCSIGKKDVKEEKSGLKLYNLSESIEITRDGGKNWELSNKSLSKPSVANLNILSMAINPQDGNDVYFGLKKGGILRTNDGGETWNFMNLKTDLIYALSLDYSNSETIFVGTVADGRGKILTSEDAGENWFEIYTFSINGPYVTSLVVDRKNPKIIYATTSDNGVIKSVDKGGSWRNIYETNNTMIRVSVSPENSAHIFLLDRSGNIYRSFDEGNIFENLSEKLYASKVPTGGYSFLEIANDRSGRIYLAGKNGIIRSQDRGETWEEVVILSNTQTAPITAFAINPNNSKEIIYGSALATFHSLDDGVTWTTSQFNLKKKISFLGFSPTDTKTIYAGFSGK